MKPGIPLRDDIGQIARGIENVTLDAIIHPQPNRGPLTAADGTKDEGNPESAHETGVPEHAKGDVLHDIELLSLMQFASLAVSTPLPQRVVPLKKRPLFLECCQPRRRIVINDVKVWQSRGALDRVSIVGARQHP